MNIRNAVRSRYLAKALVWGVIAAVCAIPAWPYLRSFAEFVKEGLNAGF